MLDYHEEIITPPYTMTEIIADWFDDHAIHILLLLNALSTAGIWTIALITAGML